MKRLLPYVIFAIAFHAIFLSTDFGWLKFSPGPTPASKTLSVTLSANQRPRHKIQAAVLDKAPEKKLAPALNQKPVKKSALVENTAQLQKLLPAMPSGNSAKKIRHKKSLKALTRKQATIKTSEVVWPAPIDRRDIVPVPHAKISSPFDSSNKPNPLLVPADTAFIKETNRVPEETLESTTTAAVQSATQIDDTLSGAVLKIARPLYRQNTSPSYPGKARRMGYEGTVMLKVLINENGRVDNLKVLQSSGYAILDRTALSTVKKWLFEPGTEGGIKKKMWVKIPIRFQLE